MSILDEYTRTAMAAMVRQKENSVRAALDEHAPGWTLLDVKRRCTMARYSGNPNEFLLLDGKAILEFFPIETEMVEKGDSYVMRVTQNVRRLGPLNGSEPGEKHG